MQKTEVAESKEIHRRFVWSSTRRELLRRTPINILCYRGELETPKWIETEPGMSHLSIDLFTKPEIRKIIMLDKYTVICTITFQLDELVNSLQQRVTENEEGKDKAYYLLEYDTVLLFGLVEFKASLIWKQDVGDVLN